MKTEHCILDNVMTKSTKASYNINLELGEW